MARVEARVSFQHDSTEYTYSAYFDAAAKSGGNHVEAIDGRNEAMCWALGGLWLTGGPQAILACLERRVGRSFDDVGGFFFAGGDDDDAVRIPPGHVSFRFFDLPEFVVDELGFRRFAGAFGLAALEADAKIGRLELAPEDRTRLRSEFVALAAGQQRSP
jgi:hypothetical protein